MCTIGCAETMIVVGVGKHLNAWVLELAPKKPDLFYAKMRALRAHIGATNGVHLHLTVGYVSQYPEYGLELAAASSNLIGMEIRYDRISIEADQSRAGGNIKRDIHTTRKSDMRR